MSATNLSYHIVSGEQFLQKLSLLVLDSFDNELVVTCYIEYGAAGSRICQLNQWLITQRILDGETEDKPIRV